jgi:glyoxylase-like metal-dependent hydrolase (beta-lactamase superfamily II)
MKVTEGVYSYIWNGMFENNCNTFYFGDPLNILFDPGLKHYTDTLIDRMKKDGIDTDKIKYVVNTHSHPDHIEGSVDFMKPGIQIAMHPEEIAFFKKYGPMFFEMMGMEYPDIKFDIELNEGTWSVGGIDLEIIKTPGHSPALICIYWKEKKTLVCGDLVFDSSFGRVDFPGGSAAQLKESILRISEFDIEHLLTGHMDIVSGRENVLNNFALIKNYFPHF